MAKSACLLMILLALLFSQAVAQRTQQGPSAEESAEQSQSQPQQIGPTQSPDPQILPSTRPQQGSNSQAEQPRPPQRPAPSQEIGAAPAGDGQLQQKIEKALTQEPNLNQAGVQAHVEGNTITLEGTVTSGKQRLTALRIARSFAGDRKVEDRIAVVQQGGRTSPQVQQQQLER